MKITYFETWQNGQQRLGTDFSNVFYNLDTERKLKNALKKHINRIEALRSIYKNLNNYVVKYHSIYR